MHVVKYALLVFAFSCVSAQAIAALTTVERVIQEGTKYTGMRIDSSSPPEPVSPNEGQRYTKISVLVPTYEDVLVKTNFTYDDSDGRYLEKIIKDPIVIKHPAYTRLYETFVFSGATWVLEDVKEVLKDSFSTVLNNYDYRVVPLPGGILLFGSAAFCLALFRRIAAV